MALSARLSPPTLAGEPGRAVGCEVLLVNDGPDAETVALETVGPAGEWAFMAPSRLVLAPGGEDCVRLLFTVPRVGPSTTDFTVRVSGTVVVEVAGSIAVAEVHDLRVAVRPMIARARRRSHHTVTVANHGNVALRAQLSATGPGAAIAVQLSGDVVEVAPGGEESVGLAVSARRPSVARQVQAHRVTVEATAGGSAPATAAPTGTCTEAVFCQEPLRWRPAALGVLALVVAVLLVWRPGSPPTGLGAGREVRSDGGPPPTALSSCPAPAAGETHLVAIEGFAYCPPAITVAAGTEVRWRNEDVAPHTVTSSEAQPFDSGVLTQGRSFATRFDAPGTYEYVCTLHPGMRATVVVTG